MLLLLLFDLVAVFKARITVADQEIWIKINVNALNRRIIACIIRPQIML